MDVTKDSQPTFGGFVQTLTMRAGRYKLESEKGKDLFPSKPPTTNLLRIQQVVLMARNLGLKKLRYVPSISNPGAEVIDNQ